jgi:hypothetical protein
MSADDPQSPTRNRRSSFAGQTFADLFGGASRPRQSTSESSSPPVSGGPITQAAAQAQRRRMSLTTLGLSGSPNQNNGMRRDSIGSANSGSIEESAIAEDDTVGAGGGSVPTTPFARRTSFGARALRDIRTASFGSQGGGGGGSPNGQNGTRSPPPAKSSGAATAQNGTSISSRGDKGRGLSCTLLLSHAS